MKAMLASGALSIKSQNHVITQKLSGHGKNCGNKAINKPLPGEEESFSIDILARLQCSYILFPCVH